YSALASGWVHARRGGARRSTEARRQKPEKKRAEDGSQSTGCLTAKAQRKKAEFFRISLLNDATTITNLKSFRKGVNIEIFALISQRPT
ncbi:MAG: hypothetical protein ACETWQ_11985, partial [Phycisphaerae bacterium]